MTETDTELVKRFLDATTHLTDEQRVAALGDVPSVSTVRRWKAEVKSVVRPLSGPNRAALKAYLLGHAAPSEVAAVRMVIGELRAKLDELESRLAPPATAEGDTALPMLPGELRPLPRKRKDEGKQAS